MPSLRKSLDPHESLSDWHHEVIRIARKHHLTERQVRDLIARVGTDRERLERAAGEVSGRS
jgi:hypothetical protein